MKKVILRVVTLVVLLTMAVSACACGFFSSRNDNDAQKQNGTENKKPLEDKKPDIEYDEMFDNYADSDEKQNNTDLSADIVFHALKNKVHTKFNIGLNAELVRIMRDDKMYAGVKFTAKNVDNEFIGVLGSIIEFFKHNEFNSSSEENDKANEIASNIDVYIDYIAEFLRGKIELSAELGVTDNGYNLKSKYVYDKSDYEIEEKGVWLGATDEDVSLLLGKNTNASTVISDYLMKSIFEDMGKDSNLRDKDLATEKSYEGDRDYDIILKNNQSAKAIAQGIASLGKLICKEKTVEQLQCLADCAEIIASWITVDKATVQADLKDNLPDKVNAGATVYINIPKDELASMIIELGKKEIISKLAVLIINFAARNLETCGINGEKDYIGLELKVNAEENFVYENVSMENVDNELFIRTDIDTDGRVMIADKLSDKAEEALFDADVYLADLISNLPTEIPQEIRTALSNGVKKTLAEIPLSEINKSTVKTVAANVLKELNTDSYGLVVKVAIQSAIKLLESSEE